MGPITLDFAVELLFLMPGQRPRSGSAVLAGRGAATFCAWECSSRGLHADDLAFHHLSFNLNLGPFRPSAFLKPQPFVP